MMSQSMTSRPAPEVTSRRLLDDDATTQVKSTSDDALPPGTAPGSRDVTRSHVDLLITIRDDDDDDDDDNGGVAETKPGGGGRYAPTVTVC